MFINMVGILHIMYIYIYTYIDTHGSTEYDMLAHACYVIVVVYYYSTYYKAVRVYLCMYSYTYV